MSFRKIRSVRRGTLLGLGVVLFLTLTTRWLGWWQPSEWWAYDRVLRGRPNAQLSQVTIVAVTEPDLRRFGFPIADDLMARALRTLDLAEPRAIGLDFYRDLPHEPGHAEFSSLLRTNPRVIGILRLVGERPGGPDPTVPPPPALPEDRTAASDLVVDGDGIVRRALLYSGPYPTLGMKLALLYLQAEGIEIAFPSADRVRLGAVDYALLSSHSGPYVNVDAGGRQILLDYQQERFSHITFGDVIDGRYDPALLRDRIVILGSVAASNQDRFLSPYSRRFWSKLVPLQIPGVEIQANIAASILAHVLQGRPVLQAVPTGLEWSWIVGWIVLYDGFALALRRCQLPLLLAGTFGGALLASVAIYAGAAAAFAAGWWLPLVPPITAIVASAIVATSIEMVARLQEYTQNLEREVRLRTEELWQQRALVEFGDLIRGVLHDVNSPLSRIDNYVTLLQQELQNETQQPDRLRRCVDPMARAVAATFQVVDTVLEAINPERVERRGERERYPTKATIELALGIATTNVEDDLRQQIEYRRELDAELPSLQIGQGELLRIVMNLTTNAVEALVEKRRAMPSFHGIVTVRACHEGDRLLLEVTDNGPGLPEDIRNALNAEYYSPDPLPQLPGGSIGIYAVAQLVRANQGTMTVESLPENGTKFSISLPTDSNISE